MRVALRINPEKIKEAIGVIFSIDRCRAENEMKDDAIRFDSEIRNLIASKSKEYERIERSR